MAKRRTIKIRGVRGKKYTKYPFFITQQDKREIALHRSKDEAGKVTGKDDGLTRTVGTQ